MFFSRLKKSACFIEFVLIFDTSDSSKGCVPDFCYPTGYTHMIPLKRLSDFVAPCSHNRFLSEEYTLVFTDDHGSLEFVVCLSLPISGYIVCIKSCFPYFELLYGLLKIVNNERLFLPENRLRLTNFVDCLDIVDGICTFTLPKDDPLSVYKFSIPDEHHHPFFQRFILEYYNTLSVSNWIVIMESLLLEKSIVFYSDSFQRVTSCILASLSLLYPLSWTHLIYPLLPLNCIDYIGCPSPFVAGVHSCLASKVREFSNPNMTLVNLDEDRVYASTVTHHPLPNLIRDWLMRRCTTAHKLLLSRGSTNKSANSSSAALLVEPFLETMAILIGGYRSAMQSTANPPDHTDAWKQRWSFDRELFVNSRGRDCAAFLSQLLQSQMVWQFLESRLAMLNSSESMIMSDDFEDVVANLKLTRRGKLGDLLPHNLINFGHLAKKLNNFKKKYGEKCTKSLDLGAILLHRKQRQEALPVTAESESDNSQSSSSYTQLLDSDNQKDWLIPQGRFFAG